MKTILLLLLTLPVLAETKIENANCAVPHSPIRWKLAYCMAVNETDDMEMAQSTNCMEEKYPGKASACDENAYWKQKWCSSIVKNFKGKTVSGCLKDKKFEPAGVAHGF